ncbi:MAG: hypothetical protein LUE10_00890 [Alistipes sp.]|nr:hypothetical protein [Alistipes sp.]
MTGVRIVEAPEAVSLSLMCGDYPVTFNAGAHEASASEKDSLGEDFE